MKAVLLKDALGSAVLALSRVPRPCLNQDSDVLIRVLAVGLDGTDHEIVTEKFGQPPEGESNLIIGHEVLGTVEEAGSASGFQPGDRVTVLVRRPCPDPQCMNCRNGRPDYCVTGNYVERGIKGVHGFLSEYVLENAEYMVRVPDSLGVLGVLVEPQSIFEKIWSEMEHIQRRLDWQPKRALVLGSGPLGLLAVLSLRVLGIETHVWSKHPSDSLQASLVSRSGAHYRSAGQEEESDKTCGGIVKYYQEVCGNGFDVILDCTGYSPLAFEAAQLLQPNGIFGLLGISPGNKRASVATDKLNQQFVLGNRCMVGSVNASRRDFESAINRLQDVRKAFGGLLIELITDKLSMEEAVNINFSEVAVKAVVSMDAKIWEG